ncbi:protein S40-1-like [Phragmites australis]|uniref:protein S40-1-like n=1 Tax=Phragmites australis TaxID=29695 RepID=UPI002D79D149|nr:protein S40-1-like [Phragmites australis]
MEEPQEADILWPDSDDHRDDNDTITDDGVMASTVPSVRPKTAPVEISRRKRRCRSWPVSEITTFNQITNGSDNEEDGCTDDGKIATNGLKIVPPHVLVARRRFGGKTAAYSMCAGKGRTLKGRDLRDVRNLVLKMTGFIEK